jgi:hypothetical protein
MIGPKGMAELESQMLNTVKEDKHKAHAMEDTVGKGLRKRSFEGANY